ncbi:MAG: DUF1540 domain-containing protein [Clostridia bacterium]
MDIKCRKTSCSYNDNYTCQADAIKVTDKMACKTYRKNHRKVEPDISKKMFEIAPEIAPFRHSKSICIKCNAHCLFNKNGDCFANGITVNDIREYPLCITYIKK